MKRLSGDQAQHVKTSSVDCDIRHFSTAELPCDLMQVSYLSRIGAIRELKCETAEFRACSLLRYDLQRKTHRNSDSVDDSFRTFLNTAHADHRVVRGPGNVADVKRHRYQFVLH